MSDRKVLVIGATGLIGEPVARGLLRNGFHVRLLVRDVARAQQQLGTSFEYVQGSIDSDEALRNGMSGVTGVHISLRASPEDPDLEPRAVSRVAEVAAGQRVARITYVSGALVYPQYLAGLPDQQAKFLAEEALRASGTPYTIFKPSYFMETLSRHIRGKRAVVMGKQAHPLDMIAADDFAEMVSRAYDAPQSANRAFYIGGPQAITIADALKIYCEVLEPNTRVASTPLWAMSAIDGLFLRRQLHSTIKLMQLMERVGVPGDIAAMNETFGSPTTTVRRWCEQERARRLRSKLRRQP